MDLAEDGQGRFERVVVRIGYWMTQGWDWFVEDLLIHLLIGLIATALLAFGQIFLMGPVAAGLALAGLRKVRGHVEAKDFLDGFRYFLPALIGSLLILVLVLAGSIFLIIPGLVILGMYQLTFHFMVDRGQDFWQAMESSRMTAARDYFGFTLFAVLLLAINFLGLAFLGIGVIVTLPITGLALTSAYLDLGTFGAEDQEAS